MNVEIRTEVAQFFFWEYVNEISVAVCWLGNDKLLVLRSTEKQPKLSLHPFASYSTCYLIYDPLFNPYTCGLEIVVLHVMAP
jgi:hypothetical protein